MSARPRVAVIGGGLFGVSAAAALAHDGAAVDLYERRADLLCEASRVNQFRLHLGYHYPRSPETGDSARRGLVAFLRHWRPAVTGGVARYYAVAASGSRVTAQQYLAACEERSLPFTLERPECLDRDAVATSIRVPELGLDPEMLRRLCWAELADAAVQVHLGSSRRAVDLLGERDYVVVAAYASSNEALEGLPDLQRPYEFRLAELPVVRLPDEFRGVSVLVMDGQFPCLDPVPGSPHHVLAHVAHSHHWSGPRADIGARYRPLLDGELHRDGPSHFERIRREAVRFFPGAERAMWIGSRYAIRTILPDVQATDARPTLITHSGAAPVSVVFSGKLSTAEDTAAAVVDRVRRVCAS